MSPVESFLFAAKLAGLNFNFGLTGVSDVEGALTELAEAHYAHQNLNAEVIGLTSWEVLEDGLIFDGEVILSGSTNKDFCIGPLTETECILAISIYRAKQHADFAEFIGPSLLAYCVARNDRYLALAEAVVPA
jgi:hypothetical protein